MADELQNVTHVPLTESAPVRRRRRREKTETKAEKKADKGNGNVVAAPAPEAEPTRRRRRRRNTQAATPANQIEIKALPWKAYLIGGEIFFKASDVLGK